MINTHTNRIRWHSVPSRMGLKQKLTAVFSTLTLSGCEIAVDIFQAGVWVGVLLVVGVIAVIGWLFSRAKG